MISNLSGHLPNGGLLPDANATSLRAETKAPKVVALEASLALMSSTCQRLSFAGKLRTAFGREAKPAVSARAASPVERHAPVPVLKR